MKLPLSGADMVQEKNNQGEIVTNIYFQKKMLTIREAVDLINHISGILLANECYKDEGQNKRYLSQENSGGLRTSS